MFTIKANDRRSSHSTSRLFNAECEHFGLALREWIKNAHTSLAKLEIGPYSIRSAALFERFLDILVVNFKSFGALAPHAASLIGVSCNFLALF